MNIDRESVLTIRDELRTAIKSVLDKHNLTFDVGRVTYVPGAEARMKLTVLQPAKNVTVTKKVSSFIPGKTYLIHGKKYEFVEFISRRPKYPYVFMRVDSGKRFKFPNTVRDSALPA